MLLKGYINDGPEHRLAIETLLGRLGKAAKQVASDLSTGEQSCKAEWFVHGEWYLGSTCK